MSAAEMIDQYVELLKEYKATFGYQAAMALSEQYVNSGNEFEPHLAETVDLMCRDISAAVWEMAQAEALNHSTPQKPRTKKEILRGFIKRLEALYPDRLVTPEQVRNYKFNLKQAQDSVALINQHIENASTPESREFWTEALALAQQKVALWQEIKQAYQAK